MAHCIQRVPLQPLSQNQNDPTIQCQMCNCATFESYLRKHIQYNHMIHRRNIVDILYKLHYPEDIFGVQTQTANTWVTDLSLAPLEHAGCFRDDPNILQKDNSGPVRNPVLCSVCGESESEMMIACDKCDGWYHWKCVGITQDPLPNDVWFCSHCINTETDDNLPAEESLPIQSPLKDLWTRNDRSGAHSREQSALQSSESQTAASSQNNVTASGQKFSESQILIREKVQDRNTNIRRERSSQQNNETNAMPAQPSTSRMSSMDLQLNANIQDKKEDEEDPFTEVVRRKRKKRSYKLEAENKIVITAEIDKKDTTPEESIVATDAFVENNMDDFDIGDDNLDDMSAEELDEFQEQKHDIFCSNIVDSEKPKLKILNTFSIKTKAKNSKSTRLGKRKEKKVGLHKIKEIVPSARKPLKILVSGQQLIPTETKTDEKPQDIIKMMIKKKDKVKIFPENQSHTVKQTTLLNKGEEIETWKGKGKGKGKRGRNKKCNYDNTNIDQPENKPFIPDTDTNSVITPQQRDFTSEEGKDLRIELSRFSSKDIKTKTSESQEIHTTKTDTKMKIKRLRTEASMKKQNKKQQSEEIEEEYLKDNCENDLLKKIEKTEKKSSNSLFDLTPFIYRIHKGKRQAMHVHLNKRNNKMRLSRETIEAAKSHYLKTPENWEERQEYMNNQYMRLQCFKFIADEYAPVVKNYKKTNKKQIGPMFWKALNRSPEKDMETFHREKLLDAKEILEIKKAQAFGTKKSSNASRKFSKEAMIACRESIDDNEDDNKQEENSDLILYQSKETGNPSRKKKNVVNKPDKIEEVVEKEAATQDYQKEHKIKSSIKKRSRKPSLSGKAKVALTFDTFIETKEEKKPKAHSPQRSRLNNILDTLRTKNVERIQKLHNTDSALEQPGPSFDSRPKQNIRYPSGSVVWAKMEESPWWPGMVDFCPDSEEYYWMEENSPEPSWYHVVFFDRGEHVTRSWIRSELIQIFDQNKNIEHTHLGDMDRTRLNDSLDMAINCLEKTRDQRLAKFSLAMLFQGSWGKSPHPNKSPFHPFLSESWEPSFIDPSDPFSPVKLPKIPEDEESPDKQTIPSLTLGIKKVFESNVEEREEQEHSGVYPKVQEDSALFHCLMCEENVPFTKPMISSHLKNHRVTLDDYPRIFVSHREERDMKVIMAWIKQDEENSESQSLPLSPVTSQSIATEEQAAALISRINFWKNQRDMFVKDKFQCDICKMSLIDKESLETHMATHTQDTSKTVKIYEEDPETIDLKNVKKATVIDQVQPVKEWITKKPAYFKGYSVVIKTKERRLANLELAFSNAPPPPPPKERAAQEPVLPSRRLNPSKSASHSPNRSKSGSATLASKGVRKEYDHSKSSSSSSKRKPEQSYKKQDEELRKKSIETLMVQNQKPKLKNENQSKDKKNEKRDTPRMDHSVEAIISRPRDETDLKETQTKSVPKTDDFKGRQTFNLEKQTEISNVQNQQPENILKDKEFSNKKESRINVAEKEDSHLKEAMDLSMKPDV